jgi:hypothetical protein
MKFPEGLISLGFIVLAALATYFVFRRTSGRTIVDRIPLFLTSAVPLLYMGLASLPFAFEPIFTKIIGHNIRDVYHFPKRADGLEFSESWWLARRQGPIQNVVFILVPVGVVWALVNAAMDRQRKANLVALWAGVGLMVLALFLSAGVAQLF